MSRIEEGTVVTTLVISLWVCDCGYVCIGVCMCLCVCVCVCGGGGVGVCVVVLGILP